MPKEFYTEKDIEDLFQRGIRSLRVNDNVVLTELAYEKAKRLDFQLITDRADHPPAAPVRPYISEPQARRPVATIGPEAPAAEAQLRPAPIRAEIVPSGQRSDLSGSAVELQKSSDVEQRIRSAVIARLGNQVDAKLLDNIIHRVVKGVGLK